MRLRLLTMLFAALTVLGSAGPAAAHPTVQLDPTLPTDVTFAATNNISYLGRFPEHAGNAGGMKVGDRFYLTDPRGVYVYDVSTPEDPQLLGSLQLFQTGTGVALAQEDPNTNGEILVVDGASSPNGSAQLTVVDVSDPDGEGLSVLGTAPVTDHTWTCVSAEVDDALNTCAYVYGRTGHMVDLTDPTNPQRVPNTWRAAVGYNGYAHDLTEIAPGLVMSAGADAILMDTSNPAAPIRLNAIAQTGRWSTYGYHSVEWARAGADAYLIAGTELAPPGATNAAGSDCDSEQSVIETWDARDVAAAVAAYRAGTADLADVRAAEFKLVDAFDAAGRGIYLDGKAPAHVLYCAHWMEPHPEFSDGGKLAVSYYDRGTRFVEVDADGKMSELGWIVPFQGYSGSVQWIGTSADGADVAYIMDYTRGMEVVALADVPATGTYEHSATLAGGSSVDTTGLLDRDEAPMIATGVVGFMVAGLRLRRRHR